MAKQTFEHANSSCSKRPCRNAQHWKLFEHNREIKDSVARIQAMRELWHGLSS